MRRPSRLPLTLGGLGAIVVLGAGASFAVGGTGNPTNDVRAQLNGAKPKNVIFLLGDGMGTQEITAARYYQGVQEQAERRPDAASPGSTRPSRSSPRPRAPYLPDYDPDSASTGTQWATGKKTLDERISQGPSSADQRPGRELQDGPRARAEARQEGRRRLDRRDHRRHAGRPRLAHLAARLPGPDRHGRLRRRETQGRRRPRLDRRAGGRPQGRRAAGRRPRPVRRRRSPAARTPGKTVVAVGAGQGLPVRHRRRRPAPASPSRASRCSACSTPATCRWSGPARPRRSARATRRPPAPRTSARPTSRAWPT